MTEKINAEVISVFPDKVKISVDDLNEFKLVEEHLKVGSYLRVADSDDAVLLAIIDSFSIEVKDSGDRKYLIEASPLGVIKNGEFVRGGDSIAIPPKKVEPAKISEIKEVYLSGLSEKEKFSFSKLSSCKEIEVPVDGDRFFNKHIAIVGSTGSGKSNTIASIIQTAVLEKESDFSGINNSHIIVFDIHSEYKSAFPDAVNLTIEDIVLPYWLLNSEELEELFLDSGDNNNYNQASVLRSVITHNKRKHNSDIQKIFYDSPIKFDIDEVVNCLVNLKSETKNAKASDRYMVVGEDGDVENGSTNPESGVQLTFDEKIDKYFSKELEFRPTKNQNITKGDYADGTLDKFVSRFVSKYKLDRLDFLFGSRSKNITFEETIQQFVGYSNGSNSNVVVIDLSGVPFEVLSITVSLISRLLFDFGYHYKKYAEKNSQNHDIPILLVLEEAHKYVPRSDLARFKSSKHSIERIAKEGRKYGVTLLLASQRPSEISETIFSQCSNFVAMRLTNPDDQSYVRRILPDTFGNLTANLSALKTGEALLMGDSVVLPSLVTINETDTPPSSTDIPYLKLWKKEWAGLDFSKFSKKWSGKTID